MLNEPSRMEGGGVTPLEAEESQGIFPMYMFGFNKNTFCRIQFSGNIICTSFKEGSLNQSVVQWVDEESDLCSLFPGERKGGLQGGKLGRRD